MSRIVGKQTMWFPDRSDTNRPVQAQKRARSLKFRILVEKELYYPGSKNKGADQLRSYCEADFCLCRLFLPMQIVGFHMWWLICFIISKSHMYSVVITLYLFEKRWLSNLCMRKPTIWVPDRSDTNRPLQTQERARALKFRI